ncbi:MAG: N-acetylneuraminate synthase [Muribaculaceae bacterium]|nr:N-acetylneuraminate synthase [Muribaculaceae bacterium]MDE6754878.1 N-acetylneuraminate synthase [Muribaculaceae bacterium]
MEKNVIIIAEAGVNHNGSVELACQLIDAAAAAGADYVKFQTFKAENLVTRTVGAAEYQKRNCKADSQFDMLKKLELRFDQFTYLAAYCRERNIGFLSTPFDQESTLFLASLGMDFMKVPSGEITNLPYLRQIASTGIPPIISTGMSSLTDVEKALEVFLKSGFKRDDIILLHCTTQYPTPFRDVNLKAMQTLREAFKTPVGYSDHTRGIEIPLAAVAMGAKVIEKHFTLDRDMEGPDHKASLNPEELSEMVTSVRHIEMALGNGIKEIAPSERENMTAARKSIVAACQIKKGEVFTEKNLTVKRPGNGISPMLWDSIVGLKATRDFNSDELIIL